MIPVHDTVAIMLTRVPSNTNASTHNHSVNGQRAALGSNQRGCRGSDPWQVLPPSYFACLKQNMPLVLLPGIQEKWKMKKGRRALVCSVASSGISLHLYTLSPSVYVCLIMSFQLTACMFIQIWEKIVTVLYTCVCLREPVCKHTILSIVTFHWLNSRALLHYYFKFDYHIITEQKQREASVMTFTEKNTEKHLITSSSWLARKPCISSNSSECIRRHPTFSLSPRLILFCFAFTLNNPGFLLLQRNDHVFKDQ